MSSLSMIRSMAVPPRPQAWQFHSPMLTFTEALACLSSCPAVGQQILRLPCPVGMRSA